MDKTEINKWMTMAKIVNGGEPRLIVRIRKMKGAVKAAPIIEEVEQMSQRQFVFDIVNRGSIFGRDILTAVMIALADSIIYNLKRGKSIKWDGLGIFRPTFRDGRLNISFVPSREALFELRQTEVKVVDESGGP